jgi:hypothetical protein
MFDKVIMLVLSPKFGYETFCYMLKIAGLTCNYFRLYMTDCKIVVSEILFRVKLQVLLVKATDSHLNALNKFGSVSNNSTHFNMNLMQVGRVWEKCQRREIVIVGLSIIN